jgi:hypothetical protein
LTTGQQNTLASTLRQVGPPNNPRTLSQRTDPQYQWLSKLHAIRKALDECIQESLDSQADETQAVVVSVRHAMDRFIHGVKGPEVALKLAASILEGSAPDLSQQVDARLEQMTRPTVPGAPQLTGVPPINAMQMGGGPPTGGAPPGGPGPMGPPGGGAPAPPASFGAG